MKEYWYILNLNPVPWRVGPLSVGRGKGGGTFAKVGRDQEMYNYQQAVRDELARQSPVLVEGDIRVTMWFWREISEYKTLESAKARSNHADGTNLYKSTEDACQGILFPNDRANVRGFWYIVDQYPGIEGRVVIKVEEIPEEHDHRSEAIDDLSDEIYEKIYGTAGEQLSLSVAAPKDHLPKEDDEYGKAADIF